MKEYPKIDIQYRRKNGQWKYVASTTQFETCEQAAQAFVNRSNMSAERVRAVMKGTEESRIGREP